MTVGAMTVGAMTVGAMTAGAMQGETAFRGDLLSPLRDERRLKRLHAARDAHDLVVRTQLEIEHGA